jgi:hypothetical protein
MTAMEIRKIVTASEELFSEAGRAADTPLRRVAVTAVCANPCAGRYVEDLAVLIEGSGVVGRRIAAIAAEMMKPYPIQSYGKAALVGIEGEVEHAEAVLTTLFGDTMRDAAGGGRAWICHMAKRALPGVPVDIPLAHKDALTIRSHYDAMTVTVPDAPMPDEIAIICCYANRGRLNHRIGGHSLDKMVGKDGLR